MTPQKHRIIAAWKYRQFRQRLNPEQLARLPANPAGTVELTAEEIGLVAGASPGTLFFTVECCQVTFLKFCQTLLQCNNTVSKTPFECPC
jgi:mersacidin/lichenicidin family type 2 lantibiotic